MYSSISGGISEPKGGTSIISLGSLIILGLLDLTIGGVALPGLDDLSGDIFPVVGLLDLTGEGCLTVLLGFTRGVFLAAAETVDFEAEEAVGPVRGALEESLETILFGSVFWGVSALFTFTSVFLGAESEALVVDFEESEEVSLEPPPEMEEEVPLTAFASLSEKLSLNALEGFAPEGTSTLFLRLPPLETPNVEVLGVENAAAGVLLASGETGADFDLLAWKKKKNRKREV